MYIAGSLQAVLVSSHIRKANHLAGSDTLLPKASKGLEVLFRSFEDRLMKTRYQHNSMAAPLAAALLRRRVVLCPFGFEWPVFVQVDPMTDTAIRKNNDFVHGYRKRRELDS